MAKKEATPEEMNKMFENFEGDTGGFEDMSGDTQSVPFIRMLQELSPQVRKTQDAYMEDAEVGMLLNTINNHLYKTPLRFVVGKFERYYIEWRPNRGGFAGVHSIESVEKRIGDDLISDDGWKIVNPANGNEFMDTYVYYVILPDYLEDGVCIFSLSSSQLKEAKKLNRNLRSTMIPGTTQRALPFFMVWNYEVMEMKNDKGEWVGPKFTLESFVTQEQLSCVTETRKELPNKTIDYNLLEQDAGKSAVAKNGEVPY
jgi:hypothetical protein